MKNQLLIRIDRRLTPLKDFAATRFVLYLTIALGTALVSTPARGADNDGIQLFNFTVAIAGPVDIRSHGCAGGTTSTGMVAPQPIALGQFVLAAFSQKGKG